MTMITIQAPDGALSTYVATPAAPGPWPGIVVIHDALGMSNDVHRQADWLAEAGYLVAAPDLFKGKTFLGCLRTVMRDFVRREGVLFDRVEAARQWVAGHDQSTGTVGLIGFCFGGGFALLLAPRGGFAAASVNYGPLPGGAAVEEFFKQSCPIVASYGALDRSLKGVAAKLEQGLSAAGIDHDVKEYPAAGHAFMNDHADDSWPFAMTVLAGLMGGAGGYHAESNRDARARILAFFSRHLQAHDPG